MTDIVNPPITLNEGNRASFHLEEFKALKAELAEDMKTLYSNLQYAIGGSGAIFALFITQRQNMEYIPLVMFVSIIPAFLTLAFGWMSLVIYRRFLIKAVYLQKLEDAFGFNTLGWEKYWASVEPTMTRIYKQFWFGLLIFDVVAATAIILIFVDFRPSSLTLWR